MLLDRRCGTYFNLTIMNEIHHRRPYNEVCKLLVVYLKICEKDRIQFCNLLGTTEMLIQNENKIKQKNLLFCAK